MGSLYAANELIDDVVSKLKAERFWENTLLVIASDNGFLLGAHSLVGKKVPYNESARVPLIVAGGKALQITPATDDHMVMLCDLAPTWLDYAKVTSSLPMDGKSLRPLLTRKAMEAWRTDLLVEFDGEKFAPAFKPSLEFILDDEMLYLGSPFHSPPYRSVRGYYDGKEYAYTEWYDPDAPFDPNAKPTDYELYNIDQDPYELNNLFFYHPELYKPLQVRLHERIKVLSEIR